MFKFCHVDTKILKLFVEQKYTHDFAASSLTKFVDALFKVSLHWSNFMNRTVKKSSHKDIVGRLKMDSQLKSAVTLGLR